MSLGLIVLSALIVIVLFGLAHRVLDRMHLTDTQAIIVLALIFAGSFIDLPLGRGPDRLTVNVGGVLVPGAIALYLLIKAGTAWEKIRALVAAVITGGVVFGLSRMTDFGPHGGSTTMLDPLWLFALVGGLTAYLFGRSRRAAFVAGVLGLVFFQVLDPFIMTSSPARTAGVALGGGGYFDAIILAGVISVGLAELIGETRERLQGGPDPNRPLPLKQALTREPEHASDDGGDDHV